MAVSPAVEKHLLDTCAWVLKPPSASASSDTRPISVLDVGCGNGIILRYLLTHASAPASGIDYTGIDLSSNMIAEAQRQYTARDPHSLRFSQVNFFSYKPANEPGDKPLSKPLSSVLFNECLHNMARPVEALARACGLVAEGGRIVVSHPRGWANVQMQRAANAWLSPSLLPSATELAQMSREIADGAGRKVEVEVAPAVKGGYLAVLRVGGG